MSLKCGGTTHSHEPVQIWRFDKFGVLSKQAISPQLIGSDEQKIFICWIFLFHIFAQLIVSDLSTRQLLYTTCAVSSTTRGHQVQARHVVKLKGNLLYPLGMRNTRRIHVGMKAMVWYSCALCLLGLFSSAAATSSFAASVNLSSTEPFTHNWEKCVGSGHMLLGTRADWRAHLKLAHDELGFVGVRGHGLLDDDMSVVSGPKRQGVYPFQFYNVDNVFDFLVETGIRPVVELSFMPSNFVDCGALRAPNATRICHFAFNDHGGYKGLAMPPDNFEDWHDLVKALAEHLVARYGLEEVSQWHFEVWNEM